MQTSTTAPNAGSGTIVEGPSRSNFRIVMKLAGALLANEDAVSLLESIWCGISTSGPDRVLRGLLEKSTYVAAVSLVGMAMRKLWSWISIENIQPGCVIYFVTVPTSQIDVLKELVKSGKMMDQVNGYLKHPKDLLESFNVSKTDVDKAVKTLPGNVNILEVKLSEDGDVKEESRKKLNVDDNSGTARFEIKGHLTVGGDAHVGGYGSYIDKREGKAATLDQLKLPVGMHSSDEKRKDKKQVVLGSVSVAGDTYQDQSGAVYDKRKMSGVKDTILLDVMGDGLAFKQEFDLSDRVNTVIVALKNSYGKDYVLKLVGGKEYLAKEKRLRDIGIADDPVLEAELAGNQE